MENAKKCVGFFFFVFCFLRKQTGSMWSSSLLHMLWVLLLEIISEYITLVLYPRPSLEGR